MLGRLDAPEAPKMRHVNARKRVTEPRVIQRAG